jgi:lysophospholipase L1-like esterase
MHVNSRFMLAVCLALVCLPARCDLAVTNYSKAKPIKIMPVGDSITDDCEINGAWRLYLQPLLDNSGIPFTFVGRQASLGGAGFTKVHHEGYCGTVIAPPGVYAVYNYSTTNAYLEKIVPDAFTNATPDIILILIGANDLGRGRDPFQVATVDMPALLDIIFSNVPNANVILTKPTTMLNATIMANGTNYGVFATNGPIYSADLQAMVNQRRALGQNVFLADMFSVVDYATMFMSDHLHPNATGLNAVAHEWFTRIQAILTGTNRITASLVHGGDLWTYADTGADFGTNWSQPGFDHSGWNSGYGRLGHGETTDETMVSNNITVYFRKAFVVPWNQVFTNLNFRLAQTGGAVVWLNGRELFRTNLPAGPVSYVTLAKTNLSGDPANIYYQTNIAGSNLLFGTNILAVEIHQSSATNTVLGFDLELLGGAYVQPPPSLSAALAQNNIVLTWPASNGAAFTLYAATNLANALWQPVNAPLQTNNSQINVSVAPGPGSAFFRLQWSQ